MKAILISFATFSIFFHCYSQEIVTDSLLHEICTTLEKSENINDSSRVSSAFEKHLGNTFENLTEIQKQKTWDSIFFRLQRNCFIFHSILRRNSVQKGDWEELDAIPKGHLKKEVCQQFKSYTSFRYLEPSGDEVKVQLKDNMWLETFLDSSFSRLKFRWIDDCSFEIEFIESNNLVRKNFSKKGDKYLYTIIEKGKGFYKLAVEIPVSNRISAFKLYFNDALNFLAFSKN